MDKIDLNEMKEDWLAGNAVVAFVGALLLGQAWEVSEGTVQLFRILTVPSYTGLVLLTFIACLFCLSLALALASLVTPLQSWALSTTRSYSTVLWWVVFLSFFLSVGYAFSALPPNQWWSPALRLGGVGMLFFILFRIGQGPRVRSWVVSAYRKLRRFLMPKLEADSTCREPNDTEQQEASEQHSFLDRLRRVRARCRWPESRGFWVSVSVAVGVGGLIVAFVWWDWLSEGASRSEVIRNVGLLIAGLVAFPLAIWRALVADRQAAAAQRQTATAQQGLLNERYQKGADMLGSEILSVRLGGIYALQSLAWDYPKQYYVQCMRLLCAFVRNPTKDDDEETNSDAYYRYGARIPKLREDVQAIMDVISERDEAQIALEVKEVFLLNLRRVNLKRAALESSNLSNVDLSWADLSDAKLAGANLSGAWLFGATLSGTKFCDAGVDGSYTSPAHGLSSFTLSHAYSDPNDPPELGGVVLDSDTGQPLVWSGESLGDELGR